MNRGNLKTANNESDVNALAGVKSPPRREYTPNEATVTKTGMLFSMKLLNCKAKLTTSQGLNKPSQRKVYNKERNQHLYKQILD